MRTSKTSKVLLLQQKQHESGVLLYMSYEAWNTICEICGRHSTTSREGPFFCRDCRRAPFFVELIGDAV